MATIKRCSICQRFFKPIVDYQKYCPKCRGTKKYYKTKPVQTKSCKKCGTEFETTKSLQEFCCDQCRYSFHAKKTLHKKLCKYCGEEFHTTKMFQEYCGEHCRTTAKGIREHNRYMEKKLMEEKE